MKIRQILLILIVVLLVLAFISSERSVLSNVYAQENGIYQDPLRQFSFEYPSTWNIQEDYRDNENEIQFDSEIILEADDGEVVVLHVWRKLRNTSLNSIVDSYLSHYLIEDDSTSKMYGSIQGNNLLLAIEEGIPFETPSRVYATFGCLDLAFRFQYVGMNSGQNINHFTKILESFSCNGHDNQESNIPLVAPSVFVDTLNAEITEDTCAGYWDPNGNTYPCGQCTWWASYSRPDIPSDYGTKWGNARDWADRAREDDKFSVIYSPEPGSVAVWEPDGDDTEEYGHVAYVVWNNGDGSFIITEMNWDDKLLNTRTVNDQSGIQFIRGGVTYFEHASFTGNWARRYSSDSSLNFGWGISSIFIPAGWDTIFYRNTGFDQSSWRHRWGSTEYNALESSFWNLSEDYFSDGSNMNDNVRSAQVTFTMCLIQPNGIQVQGSNIYVCGDVPSNPDDNIPPTGSWVTPSNGSTISASSVTLQVNASDNSGGSGVKEVRFSAKWNNDWHGVGTDNSAPYSINWNWCESGVPDGDVEIGFEVWDNSNNVWIYSQHNTNIHINKNYDCGGTGGGGTPIPGNAWNMNAWMNKYLAGYANWEGTVIWDDGNCPYIYFNWGSDGPDFPDYPEHDDEFSVRLWRNVYFPGGEYDFKVDADDGVKVFVDGQIVLDRWWDGSGAGGGGRNISSGYHEVKVEFYENHGDARLWVVWYGPGYPKPDTDPPDGRITYPELGKAYNFSPISISADAWDDASGVDHVEFYAWYCDGSCEWRHLGTDYSSPYGIVWDWAFLNDQHVWFTTHIYDKTGKVRYDPGGWVDVYLDRSKPSVTITSPQAGEIIGGEHIFIQASASDSPSGVEKVQFFAWYSNSEASWHEIGWDENGSDGWGLTWDATSVPNQSRVSLFVYAYDYAGNYEGYSIGNLTLSKRPDNDDLINESTAKTRTLTTKHKYSTYKKGHSRLNGID